MIAMALANRPDLFIADEPTTALDVTVQAQILKLLKELQAKHGMAMLFITHDLGIVRKVARDVAVMQNGRIVEAGPVSRIFADPQHDYTKALLAAEPKGDPPPSDAGAPAVFAASDVKVWFPIKRGLMRRTVGHVKAVDGVSIIVREGQTVGVVGESGSGKTTLGLAILRLIRSEGTIVYCGRRIDSLGSSRNAPVAARHADRLSGPVRLAVAPSVGRRDCRGRPAGAKDQDERGASAARRWRAPWPTPASIPPPWTAIRTSSRAASASASRSPGRWRSIRNSSCSTNRPRRSICRSRRRSSISCAICRSGAPSPTCSFRTI